MIPISHYARSGARIERYTTRLVPIRCSCLIISKNILLTCLVQICDLLLSRANKTSNNSKIMAPTTNKPSWKNPHIALESFIFYYGTGIPVRDKCKEFQNKYLAHSGASFRANVVRSIKQD